MYKLFIQQCGQRYRSPWQKSNSCLYWKIFRKVRAFERYIPLSDKQRLWSDCAYAQAGLSLCWSHIPHCWKSHVVAQILNSEKRINAILFEINALVHRASNLRESTVVFLLCNFTIKHVHVVIVPILGHIISDFEELPQRWLLTSPYIMKDTYLNQISHTFTMVISKVSEITCKFYDSNNKFGMR